MKILDANRFKEFSKVIWRVSNIHIKILHVQVQFEILLSVIECNDASTSYFISLGVYPISNIIQAQYEMVLNMQHQNKNITGLRCYWYGYTERIIIVHWKTKCIKYFAYINLQFSKTISGMLLYLCSLLLPHIFIFY